MAALARPKEWVGLVTFSSVATSPSPSSTSWPFQDHHCCFVPLSAATSTPAPKFTLITPRRALFMRIFNVRPAVTCIHHRTHHKSCKANSQKTLGVKKVANCQTSSIKVDQKSKFWRAKIFSKTLIGLKLAQLCWRVRPVFAQYQHLQIQANTNTNLQIQACLTLSVCLEHGQVAECEQRPFKERFNVTLYKPQFFPLRLYARLYAWVLLPYSWKTKTNSSLKVKTLVSWWLMSVKQGGKRHWRVEILCSTGLSPCLVIKNVTDMISMAIKRCSSYAVWQWKCVTMKKVVKEGTKRHLSCASPASQMRLTMRGTYVGATLCPRLFSLTKNTDLFLHKYFE